MIVGIGLLVLFLLTLFLFANAKEESKLVFPLDEKIEEFLNSDTFGKWEDGGEHDDGGAFYYNSSRRIMFYVENDVIKMTRDYWVHTMSNPGTYFTVKKEEFINVVKG